MGGHGISSPQRGPRGWEVSQHKEARFLHVSEAFDFPHHWRRRMEGQYPHARVGKTDCLNARRETPLVKENKS